MVYHKNLRIKENVFLFPLLISLSYSPCNINNTPYLCYLPSTTPQIKFPFFVFKFSESVNAELSAILSSTYPCFKIFLLRFIRKYGESKPIKNRKGNGILEYLSGPLAGLATSDRC